jgi:uncharacterized membrane protein HdeD (DUF308 family)
MTEVATQENIVCWYDSLLPWWLVLLWGLLSLIIGVMFLTTPVLTTELFILFIGAYWLVGGIFTLASLVVDKSNAGWKIFLSIINILAGIVILLYPFYASVFILTFFVIFIGFWGCFIGISHLYHAFKEKDAGNGVLGVISLLIGLLLLFFPFLAALFIPFILGGLAVAFGIIGIIMSSYVKKAQAVPVP